MKSSRVRRIRPAQLESPEQKLQYNRELFSVVAPKYDLVTRCLSFGSDRNWKRVLVDGLPSTPQPLSVDLACGTGDLTIAVAERYPEGKVIGLDVTDKMLTLARARVAERTNLQFDFGDMNDLPFAPQSVDVITGSYALRNAPDLQNTLFEVYRVLRPGGAAAFLDFSIPDAGFPRWIRQEILKRWGQLWGLLLHGDPEVYAYISRSLAHFPGRKSLVELLERIGFSEIVSRDFFSGFLRITWLKKPTAL